MGRGGSFRATYAVLLDTPKFRAMPSDARHSFHVLKLTRLNNMAGIFIFDAGAKLTVAAQVGIQLVDFDAAIGELISNRYVLVEDEILWIRNQVKHDPYVNLRNEKHRTAIGKVLNSLPESPIIAKYCHYYGLALPIGIPIEYQSITIGSVIRYKDPDPDPNPDKRVSPVGDADDSLSQDETRIGGTRIMIKDLEEIVGILRHFSYTPMDDKDLYPLAGRVVKMCKGDAVVALQLVQEKRGYLTGLRTVKALMATLQTIAKDAATMGEIQSRAYKGQPTQIGSVLRRMVEGSGE